MNTKSNEDRQKDTRCMLRRPYDVVRQMLFRSFVYGYSPRGIHGYHSGKSVKCPFILGAAWRINSVWHRADEEPEDNRVVLAIGEDDYPVICGPDNEEWEGSVESFGITAWAYVDDLLPDTFDDILEANKDVLERIK